MNRMRSVLVWLVALLQAIGGWVVAPDPGAWKQAAREIVQAFVVTLTGTLYALNLAWPGSLAEAKAQALIVIFNVAVPVGYAVLGALRRKVVPLIALRLSTFFAWILGKVNALA